MVSEGLEEERQLQSALLFYGRITHSNQSSPVRAIIL